MNMQRNILIAALLVITYLMVLQWNNDYGQGEPLPASETEMSMANGDLPSLPASEGADGDVPQAVEPVTGDVPTTPVQTATTPSGLISVQTDTLNVSINPLGGDIVALSLPAYPTRKDRPDLPFQLLEQSNSRTYVAQSGLAGRNGPDARANGRPLYSVEQTSYQLAEGSDSLTVDLHFSENDVNYIKRFTFNRGDYLIDVDYLIDNQSDSTWTGSLFGQIKRDSSGDPSSSSATGMATFLGAAYWSSSNSYEKLKLGKMDDSRLKETIEGGWIAWLQHYFVSAWIPNAEQQHVYQTRKDSQGNYIVGFVSPAVNLSAGEQATISADFYAGPKDQDRLKEISPGLELTVDYGFLWFIAQPLFWVLSLIHSMVGNWGWSIILLTVLIKLVFFPLSATSYRSMANMRRVAPKLQALREQFGDDRQKMSQGMMELYKKEKINPLGGCLPILVQMPVFIALYWTLMESVEMRQAPWIGWITDLSLKDPYFILPILMGVSMFIQQQLNPTPPDPMQAKVMKMLPIIFTFFFLWFPAGLVLYWVVNNILSIAQQWYITRQIEGAAEKD
ncbi:membrane protein insertase YidC [Pseudomonas sp. G11-1]|uniref:Membrane protein insertase YidC n=1 Tax=Halopseudomonas bauzanensis TaxID=653930 RepID=A0A1I4LRQ3_9GAMM|nr:membrane protein insertase YidC [Halopseudomonas bauzanensis]MCO5786951.1 membrane protein insertase YidC [Pseudomonas sp. G11-1]MCO5790177.1 membrane protein insertase YidC [Pseudomonas sp. G11-2]TKA92842.1 membrane protein insertase YidC [Halopseudomonas bauzanensis]SER87174.1 protein translocase subunit yidC [Halopseudomonas bauzanensis]SFL93684.1 YidC/Oxa1 family membrane protein insertase [Halopseudomonas bauzanensis]